MVGKSKVLKKATLQLEGMSCASCAAAVEKALNKEVGVYKASVNIASEKGTVEYDPSVVSREDFKKIVAATGYEVTGFEGDETSEAEKDDDL